MFGLVINRHFKKAERASCVKLFCHISLGFVGSGMLTASIAGFIFTAPPSIHITYALRCIAENSKGLFILLIIRNLFVINVTLIFPFSWYCGRGA